MMNELSIDAVLMRKMREPNHFHLLSHRIDFTHFFEKMLIDIDPFQRDGTYWTMENTTIAAAIVIISCDVRMI